MTRMDTKIKNQVLTNILHCLVDHKMVLQAQELAPSGIMLVILSLNASIYKQSFQILAPKGSGQDLKILLKSKIPTCNLPLFLIFAHLSVLSLSLKYGDDQFSMILQQFTSYVLICQLNDFTVYNTHLLKYWHIDTVGPEKTKWLICIPPPPLRSKETTP